MRTAGDLRSPALASAAALAVVLLAPDARAFCRTTTSSVPADFQPSPTQCWTEGVPLWWRNACVGYDIQKDASRQVSYDDAANDIAQAFAKWTGTTCPTTGDGPSRVSIDVRDLGPVDCKLVQYNSDQGNQHVIVFRDDTWPHNDSSNTLALTTVTFNPDTGEIYDADMEINTAQVKVTLSDPVPSDGYDFEAIVTHETGHFLGLAHSGDPHATMYAHYNQGSTVMRTLTADDVTGICSVYPPDGSRSVAAKVAASGKVAEEACDPTPRHGFSTQCASPPKKTGCSVTGAPFVGAARRPDDAASLAVSGALLLIFARKRKSSARRV